ncbi:hypothetical protein [Haloarchaeobius sp. DYHT-AS-18]|uniref:hypothetical protein n=1 Tax=Haloarchaeobius sp. DYHT-AS-18 TaxID=3446117 RepID=UPI003EBB2F3C
MSKHIHDENNRNKQVKFRIKEEMADDLAAVAEDNGMSRAALLRQLVEDCIEENGGTSQVGSDEYWPDREDLADLYRTCLKHANEKLILNLRVKGGMVAEDTRYSKDDLVAALRPLEQRGFVRVQIGGVYGQNLNAEVAVRVKPTTADPKQWKYRKRSLSSGVAADA